MIKKRWLIIFLIIYAAGIIGILVTACAYRGNVTITTRDSMRFISPDLEPKVDSKMDNDRTTEIHHYDDDEETPNKEEEK